MKKEERIKKQSEKLEAMKSYEKELFNQGCHYIAGVDEVGRGALAGPVVAACVILPEDFDVLGVDDSKKLSPRKREELYDIIKDKAVAWRIASIDNCKIDEINILEASKEAMREAVKATDKKLRDEKADKKDGIDCVLVDALFIDGIGDVKQIPIVKGDSKSISIAAASIVAKVTRDRMMEDYAKVYPDYAFEKNKGYGTKTHYEGLKRVGASPLHRRSFLKNFFSQS